MVAKSILPSPILNAIMSCFEEIYYIQCYSIDFDKSNCYNIILLYSIKYSYKSNVKYAHFSFDRKSIKRYVQ